MSLFREAVGARAAAAAAAAARLWLTARTRTRAAGKTPLVLVACGSFSPITYLHLRMFEMARDHLRARLPQVDVVGGVLSPVSDAYKKAGLASCAHRLQMCRLATADSDWIFTDDWEASLATWTRTRVVLEHFRARFNAGRAATAPPVRVLLLGGSDLVQSFATPKLWADEDLDVILGTFGLVAIERPDLPLATMLGEATMLARFKEDEHIFLVPQPVQNNVSSTRVRYCLRQGLSIRYLTPKAVVDYIEAHGLFKGDATPAASPALPSADSVASSGSGSTGGSTGGSAVP